MIASGFMVSQEVGWVYIAFHNPKGCYRDNDCSSKDVDLLESLCIMEIGIKGSKQRCLTP
jgi:hypothetical protein